MVSVISRSVGLFQSGLNWCKRSGYFHIRFGCTFRSKFAKKADLQVEDKKENLLKNLASAVSCSTIMVGVMHHPGFDATLGLQLVFRSARIFQ